MRAAPGAASHNPSRRLAPPSPRISVIAARLLRRSTMEQQPVPLSGLLTLVLTSTALMGSPGPSTISATAVGAAFGLRRAIGYVLGLILGTCAVLLAVASGLFALLLSVPVLAPVLTVASAAYIVFLAVR